MSEKEKIVPDVFPAEDSDVEHTTNLKKMIKKTKYFQNI